MRDVSVELATVLEKQKAAQRKEGLPSLEVRADRISRAIDVLLSNQTAFQDALISDFGHRSRDLTDFADVAASVKELRHSRKHMKSWSRPSRRSLEFPLGLIGASGKVQFQPKGVVGIMSPWNFPINLTFAPLAGVLAAGNRAMIKPSEFTPATSELMAKTIAEQFDEDEIYVITGEADVAAAFSSLPFDHLVFTGSTAVGRHVMRAAAANLVPLTLELGGKSPVIVGDSADITKAATGIMHGKTFNAGQVCISPDYVLLKEEQKGSFVEAAQAAVTKMFPEGLKDNDDYTSVLGQRHFDRMRNHVEDARTKGAEIIELNPKNEDFSQQQHHKLPPTLVMGVNDDMTIMQEEIFGPLLPVRYTSGTEDAVGYVNANPRPLALYFFGSSSQEESYVMDNTISGGVTLGDTIMHIAQENLPFGGVGPSGMGHYHGKDGFLEFSHHKAIYKQTSFDMLKFLRPPYGGMFRKFVKHNLKS
ncbi:coniferyl aldehyde dehydrogenase [Ruegeria sp. 2012CJ41-6]|uniref:Aldehyde dehydrogenase n=1 Tax=Ruegeria spongiae TaxID=2942209 RepID=A0ABT0PY28_9RHOB|nr:coniferyl aldehyde dehydrogenase [Ruegeria spongiae]MCL6282468.1 coniferyl aldehyde dehydrogenase [Ruegeria spongiae]